MDNKLKELSFNISPDSLTQLIDVLKDLSKLNDKILIKINENDTLMYSLVGTDNSINVFKNFVFETDTIFNNIGKFDGDINFIVKSGKQMLNTLRIIKTFETEISGKIYFDEIGDTLYSDRINIKVGNKLRQNFYGGDPTSMNTRITVDMIKDTFNINDANFSFDLSDDDFDKIKKLATSDEIINIFYLNVVENNEKFYATIGEGQWDITVSEVDYHIPSTIAFPKKYFKSINMVNNKAKVYVLDQSIMVITDNSNLIISIEVSI
jgi:small nuclear ribonucleoprotein (snRNP)-like protein